MANRLLAATIILFSCASTLLQAPLAHAQHKGISFQAVIKKPNGSYPNASGLSATVQILDPVNGCVLREEEHSGVNVTNGYINLVIGSPSALTTGSRNPNPVLSLQQVFDNSVPRSGLKCIGMDNTIVATNQTYTPTDYHARRLRLRLAIDGEEIVGDFNLRAAAFATNAESLGGKTPTDFISRNTSQGVTQANLESVFSRYSALDTLLNGNLPGTVANANTANTAVNVSGTVGIMNGGTGATSASAARTNLGLGTLSTMSPTGTANATTYLRGDGTWSSVAAGATGVSKVAGRDGDVVLVAADITDFATAVDGRADTRADARITAQKGANNGLATLNITGKVPSTQLALTVSDIPTLDWSKITTGKPNTLSGFGITDSVVLNAGGVASIQSGLDAAKPSDNAPATTGRLYVATDTKKIYRDNGATWDSLGSTATTDAGDLSSGTLAAARLPAFTGDVTSSAGSNSLTLGTVPLTKGGTGLTAAGGANKVLGMNAAGTAAEYKDISAGSGVTVTHSAGGIQIAATGTGGTVTSVGVAVPAYMTTSGGPVTGAGSITLGFGSQAAKQVFMAPSGAAGAPTFRNLEISDVFSSVAGASFLNTVPACSTGRALTYVSATDHIECADLTLTSSQVTTALGFTPANGTNYVAKAGDTMTGTLNLPSNGLVVGTNQLVASGGKVGIGTASPAAVLDVAGNVKVGNSGIVTCDGTTAGSIRYNSGNVEYCNGTAWTTFAASGAGITSFNGLTGNTQTLDAPGTSGTAPNWSSVGTAHTLNIPLASSATVTAGLLSNADYTTFNNKLSAVAGSTLNSGQIWVGNGSNQATAATMSGDATLSNTGALTLATSGVSANTYRSVTVDAKGRVTAGSNPTTLAGYGITDSLVANGGGVASIQSGLDAAKPSDNAPATTGRLYVATDTKKIYRDNGATWDSLGSTATTDASDLSSGTLAVGRLPAFTGDVTSSAGSNSLTLGTVPLTKGGTGLTAAGGANKILGMNAAGTAAEYKDVTAGTGVTVTHSAGGIQIAATGTGGTVTSVDVAVPAYMTTSGGPVTGAGAITLGFGSQTAKQVFAAPLGAAGAPTFRNLLITDVFSTVGGLSFLNTTPACNTGTALTYVSATDRIECADLTLTSSQVTTALGFTPANGTSYVAKTGDTMTGTLNLPANGLVVGTNQLVASGGNVGIGTASPAGILDVRGGTAAAATNGAHINIYGQNGGAGSQNGGNIILWPGTASGTGLDGAVYIGSAPATPSTAYALHVSSSTKNVVQGLEWAGTTTNPTALAFIRTRTGANLTPSDDLASISFKGRDSAGNANTGAAINSYIDGTPGLNKTPANLTFWTTPNGSATNVERVRITSSGNVGVGTTAPAALLDIAGNVKVGNSGAVTCDGTTAGSIRYNGGNVEYCNGTAWTAFAAGGAGITSLNGLTGNTQTFATPGTTGTAPNWSSVGTAHTLNIPLASSATVTAGLLSNADYTTFNNKISNDGNTPSIQSGLDGAYPAFGSAGRLYVATDSKKIYRDTGSAWVVIGSVDASDLNSGTLPAARLPAFTGDVTSSAGSNSLTLGTVPLTKGGTGLTAAGGANKILGMNAAGNAAEYKSITAGTGVTVTHSAGDIQISAAGTGGTVTSVGVAVPAYMTTSGGPITTSGSVTLGFGSQAAKQVFMAPSGAAGAPTFRNLEISDVFSSVAGASFLNTVPACSAGRALTYISATDHMECADLTLTSSQVTTALGFTPTDVNNVVAKAGDTMTGTLNLPANGLVLGTNQLVASSGNVGIGTASPTNGKLDIAGGTQTTSLPVINGAETWNSAGTTFTAAKINITDTASAAASKLLDLQVGGLSKFSVDKTGKIVGDGSGLTNIPANGSTFLAADGTAAAPGFAFNSSGNNDNGMYLPAANELGFSTSGTERIRIDSNGKIGINTAPYTGGLVDIWDNSGSTATLNIQNQNSGAAAGLNLANNNGNVGSIIAVGGANTWDGGNLQNKLLVQSTTAAGLSLLSTNASGPIALYTGGAASTNERMRIDATGKVGIGTATPAGILDVQGGTAAAGTAGTSINITAQNAGSGSANGGDIVLTSGAATGTGTKGAIKFYGRLYHNGSINASGSAMHEVNMGIAGTTTTAFGVNVDPYLSGTATADLFNSFIAITPTVGTGTLNNYVGYAMADSTVRAGYTRAAHYSVSSGTNRYNVYADGTADNYFAGNIGIGTTAPATSIDTAGAVNLRGMAAPALSPAGQGRLYYDSTANKFKVSENNGAYTDLVGAGGGVGGTGTTNSIPRFTASATLGNSGLSDNGTTVTATSRNLNVTSGQMYASQNTVASGATVDFNTGNVQVLSAPGGSAITLNNMQDGGSYSVLITDTTSRTYTFTNCTSAKFVPANAPTSGQTIYSIMKVSIGGTATCFISWITGF